ncbi:MAG: J domain-containing protein [Limnoraphis robusta]|uniref:Molecular chaperone DnaJ n=2 Tax=Limnoraphis robusta TaxID=1118279 RepID=A0A0F5YIL2_9CYAN|nr:J domain-containing protein [Limnoraphis robusta]KKD38721.1 molecular chaperone DnaJ [Limnoraphis robusta CS-951]MEA5519490.1 J domain-containing protein [Limnoraphis robusta CCNP1315]MEA5537610.1 J domain-containing protein [Limnoraphis robusta Tam1]MEA5547416.1 J domain-containing protein [Limnoraphis robusta CCNP1324]
MQNFRNYYQILGVPKDATLEEIKRVYRRLARQYHPDLNPGDKEAEEKFKDIGEAYHILSDPEKRSQYDEYSQFWKQKGFQGRKSSPFSGLKTWASKSTNGRTQTEEVDFGDYADFNTFVDQLLGRRREVRTVTADAPRVESSDPYRSPRTKAVYTAGSREAKRDIEARLTLPLEKAYTGGTERIRLEDGRSLEVNMPSAMITGQRIRLRNQGIGGGDLYLKINILPHPFFQVERSDIICEVPITPCEAVLGSEIEVPTLDGFVKLKIPPGVTSGKRLRLANKGYPTGTGNRGDQLVELKIVVPKDPSPQERELYEKLRQIEAFKPRKDLPVDL